VSVSQHAMGHAVVGDNVSDVMFTDLTVTGHSGGGIKVGRYHALLLLMRGYVCRTNSFGVHEVAFNNITDAGYPLPPYLPPILQGYSLQTGLSGSEPH
jgi:hypothetical protein